MTGSRFADLVAGVLGTKVATFGLGLVTTFLLARLLGPDGRGAYTLLLLVPVTLLTLGQLGIPAALVYLTGQGRSLAALRSAALRLTIAISVVTIVPTLLAGDELRRTVLPGTSGLGLILALAALPPLIAIAFFGAILQGRQALRALNVVSLAQAAGSLLATVALVGIAGLAVDGAVAGYVIVATGAALATVALAVRLREPAAVHDPDVAGELIRYGLRIYPGSLASFFSYRADVFLISLFLASQRAVGLYGVAVSLAELAFYVPDSIATAFFPRIAGSDRAAADRLAPQVTRIGVLATVGAAVALVPAAIIAVHLLLPAFVDGIPALVIITPGIVALSVSKILSGYVSGLGRPLPVGLVAVVSLVLNLVANVVLIPRFGIEGAAAASLLSYSANAMMMLVIASRMASVPLAALLVPRAEDARVFLALGRQTFATLAEKRRRA